MSMLDQRAHQREREHRQRQEPRLALATGQGARHQQQEQSQRDRAGSSPGELVEINDLADLIYGNCRQGHERRCDVGQRRQDKDQRQRPARDWRQLFCHLSPRYTSRENHRHVANLPTSCPLVNAVV